MCVCDHCTSRHSWDCDDGCGYPKGGCEYFHLDFDTLSKKQQKTIKRILTQEEEK